MRATGENIHPKKQSKMYEKIAPNVAIANFFPGQLAFCKKAVEGLAARRIF